MGFVSLNLRGGPLRHFGISKGSITRKHDGNVCVDSNDTRSRCIGNVFLPHQRSREGTHTHGRQIRSIHPSTKCTAYPTPAAFASVHFLVGERVHDHTIFGATHKKANDSSFVQLHHMVASPSSPSINFGILVYQDTVKLWLYTASCLYSSEAQRGQARDLNRDESSLRGGKDGAYDLSASDLVAKFLPAARR